jgi:hypothetical protein
VSAGIAGKDFGEIRSLWPETVIALSTAPSTIWIPAQTIADPVRRRAGCSGWKTRQMDVSRRAAAALRNPIAMLIKRNQEDLASLHLIALHPQLIDKEHFDYRNS